MIGESEKPKIIKLPENKSCEGTCCVTSCGGSPCGSIDTSSNKAISKIKKALDE